MIARLLRIAAIGMAIAGVVDPVLSRESRVGPRVSIVIVDAPTMGSGDALTTRGERVWASAAALKSRLEHEYETEVRVHRRGWQAAACAGEGGCIILSDGARPDRLTSGARVIGAVRVGDGKQPALTITRIDAPARVHHNAASELRVHLRAIGARGISQLQIFDNGALAGEATYRWPDAGTGDAVDARVPVDWVPLASGPRRLRVVVNPLDGEETLADNEADVGVDVRLEAAPVLLYEPEATWMGTFVRRVLDEDSRFALHGRTRVAPPVSVSHGVDGPLTREALARVSAVVVTAPDRLTEAEIDLLERFVRFRGGSVVLVPDRSPTGPVARLLPTGGAVRRESEPQAVGGLRASEILTFDTSTPGTTVLESTGGRPVVVSRAMGRGRVIVSGALDAWRYRDRDHQFSQFWSGLVADACAAAGPTLDVRLNRPVLQRGDLANVTVEWRTMEDIAPDTGAEAAFDCGSGGGVVRLWPAARRGTYAGTLEVNGAGLCWVDAIVDGVPQRVQTWVLISADARPPSGDGRDLDGAIAAHGGVVVAAGEESVLIQRVRDLLPAERRPLETRPMRSPWWIVPFAACLGAEWWIRRRASLR